MLVLTRRLGEAITIGDDVRIVVVAVEGHQVKLGIDAPKSVEVFREELYLKIKGAPFGAKKEKNSSQVGQKEEHSVK